MRFYEFSPNVDQGLEKFIIVLRNFAGRAASKKTPATLNWNALNQLSRSTGNEVTADYETFKAMYDASPALQAVVKDFNEKGITLNVPGAPDDEQPAQTGQTSQDAVDQQAAAAAPKQLAQQTATPQG